MHTQKCATYRGDFKNTGRQINTTSQIGEDRDREREKERVRERERERECSTYRNTTFTLTSHDLSVAPCVIGELQQAI